MNRAGKYLICILLIAIVLSVYWYHNIHFNLNDYDLCYQYEDRLIDKTYCVKIGIFCKIPADGYFNTLERINNVAQYINEYSGLPQSYHDLHWELPDYSGITYYVIAWMERITPSTDGITYYQYDHLIANCKVSSQQYIDSLPGVEWIDTETLDIDGHRVNVYHGRYDYRNLFNNS